MLNLINLLSFPKSNIYIQASSNIATKSRGLHLEVVQANWEKMPAKGWECSPTAASGGEEDGRRNWRWSLEWQIAKKHQRRGFDKSNGGETGSLFQNVGEKLAMN